MKEVHTSWEDSVKVLFTKPYFQHHLKSSLSNLKWFEFTHDMKSYCVGVASSKLQQTVKVTAWDEDTHKPCNCSFPLVIGLFLKCYSRWAHRAFEWSGDHKIAHTAWYAEIDHHQCLARSSVNWESPMRLKVFWLESEGVCQSWWAKFIIVTRYCKKHNLIYRNYIGILFFV